MRQVQYRLLPPVGPGTISKTGSLDEFLQNIPHLFYFGYVPSLPVVNAFLKLGRLDAGMSGGAEWTPFELQAEEYEECVQGLRARGFSRGKQLTFVPVPADIQSPTQWTCWVTSKATGAPFDKLLQLTLEERHLDALDKEIAIHGDEQASSAAHMLWYSAASALQEFLHPYLLRYRAPGG